MTYVKRLNIVPLLLLFCFMVGFMLRLSFCSYAGSIPANFTDSYSGSITANPSKPYTTLKRNFIVGTSKVYGYHSLPVSNSSGRNPYISYLFISDQPFKIYSGQDWWYEGETPKEPIDYTMYDCNTKTNGYYVVISGLSSVDPLISYTFTGMLLNPWDPKFYIQPDFVLGKDYEEPSISPSVSYDSSIPAPENLRFEQKSKSFDFLTGAKFDHSLSWSNGSASPALGVRISAVANVVYDDTGQSVPDSMLHLLSASENGTKADIGMFSISADDLKVKVLQGTTLTSVREYRVQFYRYDEGKLKLGPISTIHLNYNVLEKYTGYTVTTDRPKDEGDLGDTGGMDDFYQDKWTSDGENYDEYDKDGNHTGSGTSEDDNPIQKLLKSLSDIPKNISRFFDSLMSLMSGIGNFPTFLSKLFSFLPAEIISMVGAGFALVIVLRILGR